MRPLAANGKRTVREKTISSRFDDSGGARCARVGSELASVVDVLLASRQNESPEVVQPWQRECRPSRGLIHKDIKPANVLVDGADNVWLTGFGIASQLPHERQALGPPEMIAGTLAYMAPEQTGRMNRSIDARS